MDKTNIELYKETGKDCYRESVIKEYATLVKFLAAQVYTKSGTYLLEQSDYESYGILGLLDAIEKYDVNMDVKFETYASYRIRGSIIDEVRKMDQLSRVTRDNQKTYRHYKDIALQIFGPNFTREQLMRANNITDKELTRLEQHVALNEAVSLDDILKAKSDEPDAVVFDIPDDSIYSCCDYNMLQESLSKILATALDCLTEKERRVIELIYYEDLTQKEISLILDVSESRVSQLHLKALKKMRNNKEINEWGIV